MATYTPSQLYGSGSIGENISSVVGTTYYLKGTGNLTLVIS
jgi:hypothetical protein